MNRPEAYSIIAAILEQYRASGFRAAATGVGESSSQEVPGAFGNRYTVEVTISWSGAQQRTLEIRARIDDENTYHFAPLEERIHLTHPDD